MIGHGSVISFWELQIGNAGKGEGMDNWTLINMVKAMNDLNILL